MSTERADYLDTQTLGGGKGYFHTENTAADTSKAGPGETPLVRSSRSGESPAAAQQKAHATTTATAGSITINGGDNYETMTNAALAALAQQRGLDIPKRATKAALVALLRGE